MPPLLVECSRSAVSWIRHEHSISQCVHTARGQGGVRATPSTSHTDASSRRDIIVLQPDLPPFAPIQRAVHQKFSETLVVTSNRKGNGVESARREGRSSAYFEVFVLADHVVATRGSGDSGMTGLPVGLFPLSGGYGSTIGGGGGSPVRGVSRIAEAVAPRAIAAIVSACILDKLIGSQFGDAAACRSLLSYPLDTHNTRRGHLGERTVVGGAGVGGKTDSSTCHTIDRIVLQPPTRTTFFPTRRTLFNIVSGQNHGSIQRPSRHSDHRALVDDTTPSIPWFLLSARLCSG